MTDRLSNTELKRVKNKFASLLVRFITALKLTILALCELVYMVYDRIREIEVYVVLTGRLV